MRKVVLFCVPPTCGGAERVSLTIAKLLDPLKFDVKVLIIGKAKGEIVNFVPENSEVYYIRTQNIWDFTTCKLILLFRRLRPNIVFCSLMYLNTRVILAAKLVGHIKIIIRNNIGFNRMRADDAFLIKKLYPKADAIILQTEEMKSELMENMKLNKDKVHVLFNPIDIESINRSLKNVDSPFDPMYVNYVFVGRIDRSKGLDILISAFSDLLKVNKRCRLYIVGKINASDPYYVSLMKLSSKLGLETKIVWIGFTTNPYRYIKYADCFVLPSRVEGLPNVLLDAMYLKTPVVATRSVPVVDRIVHSERGYVVDVDDSDALGKAMLKAVDIKIETDYRQEGVAKDFVELFES